MLREIERRIIASTVECRMMDDKDVPDDHPKKKMMMMGYAALYDSMSEDLGGFREIIRPGAFDRAIREGHDILVRGEHDSRMLLGRTSSGTARVSVDAKGLHYEVDVPDTQAGRDTWTLAQRGDVRQSSFAFLVAGPDGERWSASEDGSILRELLDVDVIDVAPVAMPAYSETSVSARSLEQARALKTGANGVPASDQPKKDDPPKEEPAKEEPATVPLETLQRRNDLSVR